MQLKPIPSAPGYAAAYNGSIWRVSEPARNRTNYTREIPYEIKPIKNPQNGLLFVNAYTPKHKTLPVHKAVAEAWLGPKPDETQITHRNGDKHDNRVANLAYSPSCTKLTDKDVLRMREENLSYSEIMAEYGVCRITAVNIKTGRSWKHVIPSKIRERPSNRKLTAEQVREIRDQGLGISRVMKRYGISRNTARDVITGRTYKDF